MNTDYNAAMAQMMRSIENTPRDLFVILSAIILVQILFAFLIWWFIGRPWQTRVNNLMEAATRYLNALAAKNGGGFPPAEGYPSSTPPQAPPLTSEELRTRAYKSVEQIERRYGPKNH